MRPVTPLITVDAIIEMENGGIVLIRRKNRPYGWALPGGFVDPGESLAAAVRREVREETSLEVEVLEIFHVYSRPWRDPRGDTVSVVYHCRGEGMPEGMDDAAAAEIFDLESIPVDMAFDHGRIMDQFVRWKLRGDRPSVEE
jgi:ADP-ribose pyrophosphatase YjhB (NUDIX family)